jgi:hypothetical protein
LGKLSHLLLALSITRVPIPARPARYARFIVLLLLPPPMKTFRGLFPPLITPFHPDGRINEQGLRDHVDFVIANGADGFCGGSSTGEFMNLTRAEWERVLVITAKSP